MMKPRIVIYDLKHDQALVDAVQNATLTTDKYGVVPEHGLFGSKEWWQAIAKGDLSVEVVEGHITDVYMSGHNDFPEFKLDSGTEVTSWERKGLDTAYRVGAWLRIEFVLTKNRFSNERSPTPVRILAEASG